MKVNKYLYGWRLYVNYGQGWEYETFEDTRKGYLENKRAYAENCLYAQRWSQGRELNPYYVEPVKNSKSALLECGHAYNDDCLCNLRVSKQ